MFRAEAGIQHHLNALAAFQLRRLLDVVFRQLAQLQLFADQPLIFLHQYRLRIDQQFTAITVDDQQPLAEQRRLDVGAHHRRYPHRPHQNCRMRVGGTVAHHHAGQTILRHFGQQCRGQFIRHQHKTRRPPGGARVVSSRWNSRRWPSARRSLPRSRM